MRSLHDLMAAVLLALVVTPAHAQEDAPVGAPSFQEGDVCRRPVHDPHRGERAWAAGFGRRK